MKFIIPTNNLLKNLFICTLLSALLSFIITEREAPKVNVYKTDKSVKHSLFREKNAFDRVSNSHDGVPPKKG